MIVTVAAVAHLAYGGGYVNVDAMYSLVWGQDLARGQLPQFGGVPTPHPLSNLVAALLAPFGARAQDALIGISYLSVGLLVWTTWLAGSRLFGVVAGVVAAVLVATRDVVTFHAALAYLDVPWAALMMAAVALEVGAPRNGERTLVILAVAGLLRPEAWFVTAMYWSWMLPQVDRRRALRLAVISASAPALWLLADLVVTGDPLFSFTGTRDAAATLQGGTSDAAALFSAGPRILGQPIRPAVVVCALAGIILALVLRRRQATTAIGWTTALTVAFAIPVVAGTVLSARYAIPTVALICVFAGAAIGVGLTSSHLGGKIVAAASAALLLVTLPSQVSRLDSFRDQVRRVDATRTSVESLLSGSVPCQPIVVPNGRLVPLAAICRDVEAEQIVRGDRSPTSRGSFVSGTPDALQGLVVLPTRDSGKRLPAIPDTTRVVRRRGGWTLSASCGG